MQAPDIMEWPLGKLPPGAQTPWGTRSGLKRSKNVFRNVETTSPVITDPDTNRAVRLLLSRSRSRQPPPLGAQAQSRYPSADPLRAVCCSRLP